MPEGDTIYRTAATLHRALAGRVVVRFETAYAHLARVDDDAPIAGRTVESASAAGKHVLMRFSAGQARMGEDAVAAQGELVLRTHMRMSGSWHLYRPGERWRLPRSAMRIVVATDAWEAIAFNVPVAELIPTAALSRHQPVATLGPDLLGAAFDADEAVRRIQGRPHESIAEALLDQRLVAGIGNIYKSETLFVAGVHPDTPIDTLAAATLATVLGHARRLLQANVAPTSPAAIVTYRGLRSISRRGEHEDGMWVYGRRGKPCRKCGTPIESRKTGLNARSTYWCPHCQVIDR